MIEQLSRFRGRRWAILALTLLLTGCTARVVKRQWIPFEDLHSLDGRAPFLKAHLHGGRVIVMEDWTVQDEARTVTGRGILYGLSRQVITEGPMTVPVDSVAIFESNVIQSSGSIAPLAILTVASASLSIYCLANPKACFGSCPTFHAEGEDGPLLQAEGFSASVAPTLEDDDVDALYRARADGRRFVLRMTNEALETHVVRQADLLVAPRPEGGRVYQAGRNRFVSAIGLARPLRATGPEGDCLDKLASFDGAERFSAADPVDLAGRESLDLAFQVADPGPKGLVIVSRQTLLSTYLFYQGLAFLGEKAAGALVKAEQVLEPEPGRNTIGGLLGRIEVATRRADGSWWPAGSAGETGPLAANVHLVDLGEQEPGELAVRLELARGHWRIDQVLLVDLGPEVEPVRISPREVLVEGHRDPVALEELLDPASSLVTFPGAAYELVYDLPEGESGHELFLHSRGYYLEWMRREWLAEEDPARAAMLFLAPGAALRALAPEFKEMEPGMEAQFWGSRYAR
ncbi:hypothetical protein KJ682_17810 [bacterium]|nr:hypothetical protein [bacterium]